MLEEAERYHAWDPQRVCIKVPFSETGLRVLNKLVKRGVATTSTCLMSFNQAYLAALAARPTISIFSGRVRDMGYDVRPSSRRRAKSSIAKSSVAKSSWARFGI